MSAENSKINLTIIINTAQKYKMQIYQEIISSLVTTS